MGKPFTTGWYDRIEALVALALAKSASSASGTNTVWTDVAPGTTLTPTASQQALSCNTAGPGQIVVNLPAAPTNGREQVIRCTGNMLQPVVVNAQGAGITVELLNAPGTFGASTWMPIQGEVLVLKYDGTPGVTAWKVKGHSTDGTPNQTSYNPGWYAFAEIDVDPQNVSTVALDSNSGAPGAPLRTYAEAVRRWGGLAPNLPTTLVSLALVFLSSHTDVSDPVVWKPIIRNGALVSIQGAAPTVLSAGVLLAGTVAKNRTAGANSALQTTLSAAAAVGQMVSNTTHPSRSWAQKALGANAFQMCQPYVAQTVGGTTTPAQVNTWADTNSVNLLAPIAVNIVDIEPTIIDGFGSFTIYQLTGFSPGGVDAGLMTLNANNGNIVAQECSFQRLINSYSSVQNAVTLTNCLMIGGIVWSGGCTIIGGSFLVAGGGDSMFNTLLDGDLIIGGGMTISGIAGVGLVFLDANLTVQSGTASFQTLSYGSHVLYGSAAKTVSFTGHAKGVMASGTWAAGWTAPTLVTGVTMNGGTVAQTHTNASPDVVTSNVTTSVANADAANGGNMMVWGGASISKAA